MLAKSQIIVLHTIKHGDTGIVVQCYSNTAGRTALYFRGSSKKMQNAALLHKLNILDVVTYTNGIQSMPTIREIAVPHNLSSLRSDIYKSSIAIFISELLGKTVRESEANPHLYSFISSSIQILEHIEEGVANFHMWFLSNLCRFLGFSPGNEYMPEAWFDISEGLYTADAPPREHRMSQQNALILRDMLECDVRYLSEVGLNRHQRVDFLDALLAYYAYHLDTIHSVQSIRILQEVF